MRSGKTRANIDALSAWLDTVALTKPITLEDKTELMRLVKEACRADSVRVEVYSQRDPDEVFLRIEYTDHVVERTFRAV